jgi:FkbM family methyltransferase
MLESLKAYCRDVVRIWNLAGDVASLAQYTVDRMLIMLIGRITLPGKDKVREIRFRDGMKLTYRLNRGDMQSIREVWLDEVYKLPFLGKRNTLVDLGANIGLTSAWLARRYACEKVIAVEPVQSNAALVKRNLAANSVSAEIIGAAVGPMDGVARFQDNDSSNLGRVGRTGYEVPMICMNTLLRGESIIDILKIDIEGGEQALLTSGDMSWLKQIREIIIEFHPDLVDYPGLVNILKNAGFEYFAAGKAFPGSMDYFRRRGDLPNS